MLYETNKPKFIHDLEIKYGGQTKAYKNLLDFSSISFFDSSFKADIACMEAPVFSLSKHRDTEQWSWTSVDGKKTVKVTSSAECGRATIFDKDILIYIVSCLVHSKSNGQPISKTVRFCAYDYLKATFKAVGGREYYRLDSALQRLFNTAIETNIKTGKVVIKTCFHLVDKYELIRNENQLDWVEVTICDWLFNAVGSFEVLTLNKEYFKLKKPLERRLYEIARKHCESKAFWLIKIDNLLKKVGSRSEMKEFKRMLMKIIESDFIPDYRLSIQNNLVKFYQKDPKKLLAALNARRK